MATIFTSDFEGATPFAPWDATTGTVTQDTGIFHNGAASAKIDSVSGPSYLRETISGTPKLLVTQFWTYFPDTFPFTDVGVYRLPIGLGASRFYITTNFNTTTGDARMQLVDNTSEGYETFSWNTWHKVTLRANVTGSIWTVDWNFDSNEQVQLTYNAGGSPDGFVDEHQLGNVFLGGANAMHYNDDVRIGDASADYEAYKGVSEPPTFIIPFRVF